MKRANGIIISTIVVMLLLLPIYGAYCQTYVEYDVEIMEDGSASWRIIQVSDVNVPIDSWIDFQQRVVDLIDSAANASHREMALDFDSLQIQIDTTTSAESKTTTYTFVWQNFSIIQDQRIVIGDVFHVNDFFSRLYGDASLRMTYPTNFAVSSVSPGPNLNDTETHTLSWYRTQDFLYGSPNIILTSDTAIKNGFDYGLLYVGLGVIFAVVISLVGSYFLLKRRQSTDKSLVVTSPSITLPIETDEEKVINIIKSSGGMIRQSTITEQSKFSKAKTSQLLTDLEQRRIVMRVKKGRDKIVSLNNEKVRGIQP